MPEFKQSPLLSLAPELIQVITNELTIQTIKCLRLTCTQLGEFLNARLFRELTINFSQATFENDLSKVRFLATTNCHAASSGTRKLKIASLSPGYDPEYQGPSWNLVDGEWVRGPVPEDPPETKVAEEELRGHLYKAIASLRGVQSVEWKSLSKDSEWAQDAVMSALKTLPNFRVLLLHINYCKIPLPLDDLSGIQEISIVGISEMYQAELLDNLAKLVARTPKITFIEILGDWCSSEPGHSRQNLHQIFKYYPKNSAPLRLRHLSLKTCLVKLDNATLPHLQHLTSLSLMNIVNVEQSYNRRSPTSELLDVEKRKAYGSSLNDIWKALTLSRVQLEELALDVVVPSFLDYLASYSGLKKLSLIAGGFQEGSSSDLMATRFFSTPFTNHVQSLEHLSITALYEGAWCFSQSNLAVISRCTRLKVIRMAIVSGQLYPLPGIPDKIDVAAERNVVGCFIDTVSNSMPRLENLVISAANLERLRRARCGNPAMSHFHCAVRDMLTSVHRYRALPTCHRLPHLMVESRFASEKFFVPGGPDEHGRLHYSSEHPSRSG